jgi:hypothetical protein
LKTWIQRIPKRSRNAVQVLSVAITLGVIAVALMAGLYLGGGNAQSQTTRPLYINLPTNSGSSPSTVFLTTVHTVTSNGSTYTVTGTSEVIYVNLTTTEIVNYTSVSTMPASTVTNSTTVVSVSTIYIITVSTTTSDSTIYSTVTMPTTTTVISTVVSNSTTTTTTTTTSYSYNATTTYTCTYFVPPC